MHKTLIELKNTHANIAGGNVEAAGCTGSWRIIVVSSVPYERR